MIIQGHQGDVYFEKVDITPELEDAPIRSMSGAEIKDAIVLAHGEVTGHAHVIRSPNAILLKVKDPEKYHDKDHYYFIVTKPVALTHEEHSPALFAPGIYRTLIQRRYQKKIKAVVD